MDEDEYSTAADGQVVGPQPQSLVQWKRGLEVPPLVHTNPAAVQLCTAILAGEPVQLPEVFMSEAIAVQIYILVVEEKAVSHSNMEKSVYVILASLARRRRSSQTAGEGAGPQRQARPDGARARARPARGGEKARARR